MDRLGHWCDHHYRIYFGFVTTFKQGFFICPSANCFTLSETCDHAIGHRSGDGTGGGINF